ncbi:MAG: DUF4190 domain-containing protein [Pyrinomonadaceae bacterium]
MKQCPRCNQTYSDENLNFCLDDGELLTGYAHEPAPTRYDDDSPPTIMLNDSRVTNPSNWQAPVRWQPRQQNVENRPFASPAFVQSRDQTLPTIALILGILSLPLICCYGGIWLGLPAAVLGFLGMRNADSDRSRYGGRGMAIGGMVLGVISFLTSIIIGIIALIAR